MNLYIIGVKTIYIIGITGNVFSKMGMFLTQILVQTSVGTFDDSRDFFPFAGGKIYSENMFLQIYPTWLKCIDTGKQLVGQQGIVELVFFLFQLDSNQYIISTRFKTLLLPEAPIGIQADPRLCRA